MGRSLLETVTIEELKTMYDSGMTYKDISETLGVGYSTVCNHLRGYGRRGGSRIAASINIPKEKPAPAEEPAARLSVQNKSIELHGLFGIYVVDCKKNNVIVTLPKSETEEDIFEVSFEQLDDIIGELQAIRRKVESLGISGEMW